MKHFSVYFSFIQLQNIQLHTFFPTYTTKLKYIRVKYKILQIYET